MEPLPLRLDPLIDDLVTDEGQHTISIARTIRRIREAIPDLASADNHLARLVAARAVRNGNGVEFDEIDLAVVEAAEGACNDRANEPGCARSL